MQINIYQGHHIDQISPSAITVVIDVLRAFSVASTAFQQGVSELRLIRTVEEAIAYKDKHMDTVLVGEVNGYFIPGFDFSNSPKLLKAADINNKSMVLRTTNGVESTLNVCDRGRTLVAGFVNANSTAEYLREQMQEGGVDEINLLATDRRKSDEDLACADFIKAKLINDGFVEPEPYSQRIINAANAEKFMDDNNKDFDKDDLFYCAKLDLTAPVLECKKNNEAILLEELSYAVMD